MSKQWWQFWKRRHRTASRIFGCGYPLTPGSQLHRRAVEVLRLGTAEQLEKDMNVQLPGANVIDRPVHEWTVLGHGVVSDEQRWTMRRREKEIGQALHELGGIDLMQSVAYKLIYAGRAFESDFTEWSGIGSWQN